MPRTKSKKNLLPQEKTLKVLSALQVLGHPRDSKRISMLKEAGFDVSVAAFERSYHSGRLPDTSVVKLGRIENRNYIKRIWKILKAIPILRREIRKNDVVYASGQDMAAMAFIAGMGFSKPIVLEVGDIVDMQLVKNWLGSIVRSVEKFFVNQYKLIVVISPGFLEGYYYGWLKVRTPGLVIENKLESSIVSIQETKSYTPFRDGPLRIGYFGLLRDQWSFDVLSKLAQEMPEKYSIVFAGMLVNPPDLDQKIKGSANMRYFGEYKSPSDLPTLYNQVDMVWACYPVIGENDWNLKWGRPNRFFESCFYKKPTFCRLGAHFANDVDKLNIGKVITTYKLDEVIDEIESVNLELYQEWQRNIGDLPKSVFMYDSETQQLASAIKRII